MSFRTRLFLGLLITALIPLGALAYGVRREMDRRLTAEYQGRVSSMVAVIEMDLERESRAIAVRLDALGTTMAGDNRIRLGLLRGEASARRYLLDYAGQAMELSGLSMLQLQDSSGRILSSGHFRNQFDQSQPELLRFLTGAPGTMVLVRTRTPEAALLALARTDSTRVAGRLVALTGGIEAQRLLGRLAQDKELSVELIHPGAAGAVPAGERVIRELSLPYIDLIDGLGGAAGDSARLVVSQSLVTLTQLRRSIDRWLLLTLVLSVAAAVVGAAWLSSRISRPLRDLAGKTANIDLDRLEQRFESDRADEIGTLSRVLGAMTDRLRTGAAKLREAERRAAVGDLARQVNHDIKNGLSPIRNVLRHLAQVARDDPGRLPGVYEDRRGTLDSSIEYLENLARNYARLSPALERRPCDLNAIVTQVLGNTATDGSVLHARLSEPLPPVQGDSVMLRRILENLVGNALDSVSGRPGGEVTVSTQAGGGKDPQVRVTVSDTGPGMSRAELDRAFDDFYTTKTGGTGLGLSIVRRLILDLNGSLRIETEPGTGTRVLVELPAHSEAAEK